MKQCSCIINLTIIALLAIAISLLAYYIYHSKKYEVALISILDTTTIANNQLTNGFTTKTSSTDVTTTVETDMSTTMGIASTQVTNNPSSIQITSTMMNNNVQTSTFTQSVFWNIDKPSNTARSNFGSALLANGQVLVAGGLITSSSAISQTEVYTSTGWQLAPSMKLARAYHTVTAFANNTKVLAAGSATTNGLQTAE
ncbi:unnamed protein product, partial [Adineta steineri]